MWWSVTCVPMRCRGCGADRILLALPQLCTGCSGGNVRAIDLVTPAPAPVPERSEGVVTWWS